MRTLKEIEMEVISLEEQEHAAILAGDDINILIEIDEKRNELLAELDALEVKGTLV